MRTPVNLNRLAYFAAVVESGSFTAAAARLGVTKAVVSQREAELVATQKRFARTETLVKRNAMPQQQLDDDRAVMQSAQAALAASRSQVISAQAGI
eukprot:gene1689-2109_t